jgi:hypothetical protein
MELRERFDLIAQIAERAEKMNLLMFDRLTLIMDLRAADKQFNLRLEDFLKADDFNFAHDIVGIQQNMDREESVVRRMLPRFASVNR